jgi:formylglycine-generating enzyme required for sulfatase activity
VKTYAFQIGKFEVSKALWDEVRAWAFTNGYTDLPEAGGKTPEHPAHGINWFDALKWCNARSEKEGLTPVYIDNRAVMKTGTSIPTVNWSADGYRLPSEAEWEKAARGGRSDRRFPWGDTISHSQANYLSSSSISYDVSPTRGQHPSYAVAPSPFTSPIGSFAANDYGLHDTSGNVREWCWDWYDAAYYSNNALDPRGPATGTNRVIRGGSSEAGAEDSRSMHRGSQAPTPANPSDGFRVARGPLVSLTAPAIITQPASSTIASGTTTTLRVTAAGNSPMTYQWYQGAVGTTTTPVGTNSPNFTTPALTATTSYWVRISNADGILNSAAVTVTIPVAPGITMQPDSTTINSGETATLAVTATGTAPLTYQWYQGAVGTTTSPVGANSASFTTPALTATTTYWVRVSNSAGSVDSTLATVTVTQRPAITTQPVSTTINSGSTATLTVTATGTAPMTYQWYQGAVGTTTTPVGTNSASFTTPALTATTTYWVRITNAAGTVDSTLATVTVGSSTPADLALIPAGAFQMGRTSGDTDTNAPSVSVTVSAFYMGKNEVTKALWDEVRTWAAANGYTDLATGAGKAANHPVQTVSWWDVIKWCNARSEKEGLTPCYTVSGSVMKTGTTAPTVNWSANGYRLPTEAEWEKAARGGVSGKRFPWGTDTISHSQANFSNNGGESYQSGTSGSHPTYASGSYPYTSPVGSFAANAYGLHDMAGNVYEWCWDWYGASTYVNGATDPRGAASGTYRVGRGGSWDFSAYYCRAASRNNRGPTSRYNFIGFRIARSSVP